MPEHIYPNPQPRIFHSIFSDGEVCWKTAKALERWFKGEIAKEEDGVLLDACEHVGINTQDKDILPQLPARFKSMAACYGNPLALQLYAVALSQKLYPSNKQVKQDPRDVASNDAIVQGFTDHTELAQTGENVALLTLTGALNGSSRCAYNTRIPLLHSTNDPLRTHIRENYIDLCKEIDVTNITQLCASLTKVAWIDQKIRNQLSKFGSFEYFSKNSYSDGAMSKFRHDATVMLQQKIGTDRIEKLFAFDNKR
jgi:hypothetical protein